MMQYVGARYVPKFMGNYDNTQNYENMCVVDNGLGTSYISKKPVPAGTPLTDTDYWAVYGSASGAIITLQNQIDDINNNKIPSINNALKALAENTDSVMFYFPPIRTGTFQSASCMMVIDKKAYIFDCGAANSRTEMMSYYNSLYNAGIFEEIAMIIISHYHIDHMGNFEQIVTAYPHTDDCIVYLPLNPDGYYPDAVQDQLILNRNEIITACNTASIPYVDIVAETSLPINDLVDIDLFNSSPVDYTYYSSIGSEYNNYSMVALVRVGKIYAMFAGDIQYDGEVHIMSQKTLPRLFLYPINHHGLQWDDDVAFMNAIAPEWGVAQISPNRVRNIDGLLPKYCCKHICASAYSDHIFAMSKDAGYIVSGDDVKTLCGTVPSTKIYVDNSYVGTVKDGSQARPFVDINDALNFAKIGNVKTIIYVKATNVTYTTPRVAFLDNVQIEGVADGGYTKPTINGIHIQDCNEVVLYRLIFEGIESIDSAILYAETSYVNVADCDFVGVTVSPQDVALKNYLSKIYVHGCTFTDVRGMQSVVHGEYYMDANTYNGCDSCITLINSKVTIKGIDTLNSVTTYIQSVSSLAMIPFDVSANISDTTALSANMALNSDYARSNLFLAGSKDYRVVGKKIIADNKSHVIRIEKEVTTGANGSINISTEFGLYRATRPVISVNPIDVNAAYYAVTMETSTNEFATIRKTSDDTPLASSTITVEVIYLDLTGEDFQA